MNDRSLRELSSKVELTQLRHVVAAADYGSIRKAAEALNVRQSTLSRSIRQFEHVASMSIFNRSSGGVIPTEPGRTVIRTARIVLEEIDGLARSRDSDGFGFAGRLGVGFCTSLSAGNLRASLVDFRIKFPEYRVIALERSRTRLAIALRNGGVDVIIATGNATSPKFRTEVLWGERVLIALPEDHPLADRKIVYWTDLKAETLLMSRYDPYREFEDLVTAKLLSQEHRPRIERHDVSRSILKSLIGMKLGLGLMLESDAGAVVPSIVFRELRDGAGTTRMEFSAVWQEENDNPALASYIRLLKERYLSLS